MLNSKKINKLVFAHSSNERKIVTNYIKNEYKIDETINMSVFTESLEETELERAIAHIVKLSMQNNIAVKQTLLLMRYVYVANNRHSANAETERAKAYSFFDKLIETICA